MRIGISPTWTFKEVVKNIKTIKFQYEEVLSSFSVYELCDEIEFRRELRDNIYSLKMEEYKKDRLWEYINGCLEFRTLKNICEREKHGKRNKKQIKISYKQEKGFNNNL